MKEHEPIPGERDRTTAAPTDKGIVGTTGYGGDLQKGTTNDSTLNEADHDRNRWEGGGRPVPRPGPDSEAQPGERQPDEGTAESPGNASSKTPA